MNIAQNQKEEQVYATSPEFFSPIPADEITKGVKPLDTLPAAWWNWIWNLMTEQNNNIFLDINNLRQEMLSVLNAAGITPSDAATNQLLQAIEKIRTTIATATATGSVLSSSDTKSVSVDSTTGQMLVNALVDWASPDTIKKVIDNLDTTLTNKIDDLEALIGKGDANNWSGTTDEYTAALAITDEYDDGYIKDRSGVDIFDYEQETMFPVSSIVQTGDLNPVNSNAVAEAIKYVVSAPDWSRATPIQGFPFSSIESGWIVGEIFGVIEGDYDMKLTANGVMIAEVHNNAGIHSTIQVQCPIEAGVVVDLTNAGNIMTSGNRLSFVPYKNKIGEII